MKKLSSRILGLLLALVMLTAGMSLAAAETA